jgi:hypothetical protein
MGGLGDMMADIGLVLSLAGHSGSVQEPQQWYIRLEEGTEEMPDSADLTTRDVFAQIDRRLTRLEDDLREFRQYVERRFQQRFVSIEEKLDSRFNALDTKIDRNFRRHLSISLALWLSVMSTILLK